MITLLWLACPFALNVTGHVDGVAEDIAGAISSTASDLSLEVAYGSQHELFVVQTMCRCKGTSPILGDIYGARVVANVAAQPLQAPSCACTPEAETTQTEANAAAVARWRRDYLSKFRADVTRSLTVIAAAQGASFRIHAEPPGALITLPDTKRRYEPQVSDLRIDCLPDGEPFEVLVSHQGYEPARTKITATRDPKPTVVKLVKPEKLIVQVLATAWVVGPEIDRYLAWGAGGIFVLLLLVIVLFVPHPSEFQQFVFRAVLAVALAGLAGLVPGFLNVDMTGRGLAIRAGGALAVFLIVYLLNPAKLIANARPVRRRRG